MNELSVSSLVRWLNPILGRYISKKSGKQFSEDHIKQILSERYPKQWNILYSLLVLGYLAITVGLFITTLFVLSKKYNVPPNTPMPDFIIIISLIMFFLYIFWVGFIYFTLVTKLASRRFYKYMLMRQVKSEFAVSLEDSIGIMLRLSIIITLITLPIIIYLFLNN